MQRSLQLGERLRVGNGEVPMILMECLYYPDRGNSSWTWIDPVSNQSREDLPTCAAKCALNPLARSDLQSNWSGLVSQGTWQNIINIA